MKKIFYFVVVISLFLVSCGGNSTSSEKENIEKTTNIEQVVEQPEVIMSTVMRVDRIISRGSQASFSKTVLFTEDCRTFTFRDDENIGYANVREGDCVHYKICSNGKTKLVDITYVFDK